MMCVSIVVTDDDPGWPAWFEAERAGLEPVLSPWLSGGIERLAFRDALRADPQLAARYQELKRQLARSAAGITAYTKGKRAFVAAALAVAGVPLADPAGQPACAPRRWGCCRAPSWPAVTL